MFGIWRIMFISADLDRVCALSTLQSREELKRFKKIIRTFATVLVNIITALTNSNMWIHWLVCKMKILFLLQERQVSKHSLSKFPPPPSATQIYKMFNS
jgi:hypothetical protein